MTGSNATGPDSGSARSANTERSHRPLRRRPDVEPLAELRPGGLRRRRLFGLDLVDDADLGAVLDAVLSHRADDPSYAGGAAAPDRGQGDELPVLLTPNVDIIVHLSEYEGSPEADVFRRARYVLPDGMPLVAASRLLRRPLAGRLTGSGLFELLWPRLLADKQRLVALCASDEIVRRLDPGTERVSFVVPPWFDQRALAELDAVVDSILVALHWADADYLLLGLGNPKDAVVAGRLLERWPSEGGPPPLVLGLGGSFAMYAGIQKRAPGWVQRIGLEWFYRFAQEPRRLFHRYFVRDLAFFRIVAAEAWRSRTAGSRRRENSRSRDKERS